MVGGSTPRVEAAAYFCVAEAARDLGDPVAVACQRSTASCCVIVTGGDRGGLPLSHIRDRVEAAVGTIVACQHGRLDLPGRRRFPGPPQLVAASIPRAGGPGPKADLVT